MDSGNQSKERGGEFLYIFENNEIFSHRLLLILIKSNNRWNISLIWALVFFKTMIKAVVSENENFNIMAKISINWDINIPYIVNYLAFHQASIFMKLLDIEKEHCSHLPLQVIFMHVDNVWHLRRSGIVSHFGALSGMSCLVLSKNVC